MPRLDGVIAAMVGIAFGMLATLWMVLITFTARLRGGDAWPRVRRSLPGIVAFGASSIVLMGAARVFHADPVMLDHLAKVLAVLVPIVAVVLTVRAHKRA
ncbi:MAG: hypothetical protein ACXWUG_01190 [Polyangiales bacterium]